MTKFLNFFIMILSLSFNPIQAVSKENVRPNYFVQLVTDSEMLNGFRCEISALINSIVKKELEKLGLEKNYYFNFFQAKPIQRLSIYYFYEIDTTKQNTLLTKIENLAKDIAPQKTLIKPEINFFGEWGNEFVMMLEGPHLTDLNIQLKELATNINKNAKKPFYNIDKSEKFAFLPHTGIGMLRVNRITDHLRRLTNNNSDIIDITITSIKQQIKKAVEERISKLSLDQRTITFKTLGVFDPKLRKDTSPICTGYLQEYNLSA